MEKLPENYYGKPVNLSMLPEADPDDVRTIESIIRASYECISGPPGKEPDWRRQHTLFLPEARSIRTGVLDDGTVTYKVMSTQEYIAQMHEWLTENGFYETEVHRIEEQFGNIAHAFSTYESKRSPEEEPFMRGINSFQLFYDGKRWWIMNIMWRHESSDLPLPPQYLP